MDNEVQYVMKGYPNMAAMALGSSIEGKNNAYVYVDSMGGLCIYGGSTSGWLCIPKDKLDCIVGDAAPGH